MRFLLSGLIALAVCFVPGCHRQHRADSGPRPAQHVHPKFGHPEWSVVATHQHDDNCGHYHHGGRWYAQGEHRHGPSCGHHFRGGIWIVSD